MLGRFQAGCCSCSVERQAASRQTRDRVSRMTRRSTLTLHILLSFAFAAIAAPVRAQAPQPRALSLEDAMALASRTSEAIQIAAADVTRAGTARVSAASQRRPQLFGTVSYARTLRSQFQGLADDRSDGAAEPAAPCDPFEPDPTLPVEHRIAALERTLHCQSSGNGFGSIVSRLPFGRENQWSFGLSASQSLFTAGRLAAQQRAAGAAAQSAGVALRSVQADTRLTVAEAYFDALLADRFVEIASATLEQQERVLDQTTLMQRVGTRPQFDVLRARVALDALRPTLIRQRSARDLAYVRLKQLLDLPLDAPLALTTRFAPDTEPASVAPAVDRRATEAASADDAGARAAGNPPDVAAPAPEDRAPVREAALEVDRLDALFAAARAQRWPSVSANAQLQQVAYPSGLVPTGDFLSNWTVGFSVDVPLFTGGRLSAAVEDARASLAQGRLRLAQTQELAELDTADALLNLEAARATWSASAGTVDQAVEAYRIAEIRFREGLSTQIELSDSQLLLQQARANRAQADRDLRLARLRVALLNDLPLSAGSAPGAPASNGSAPRTFTAPQTAPGGPVSGGASTVAGAQPSSGSATPGIVQGATTGGLR
jgi:outer membrane protein TolC